LFRNGKIEKYKELHWHEKVLLDAEYVL